jgi:RNA polymerase sigma-70 factor, ECF subfamily
LVTDWARRPGLLHDGIEPSGHRSWPPISAGRSIIDHAAGSNRTADRTERSVVDAVLGGDRDAYRSLVETESAGVLRAVHRILGDLHEAEDVTQEAFVIAYRSLASWRGDGPFGAWLTRIAVRLALRRVVRRRPVVWLDQVVASPSGTERTTTLPGAAGLAAGPSSDPAALAVRSERDRAVRSAVAGLPEPYREVVALRFFGELSLDEIARQTERPLGTVKTHLRRGLLRLREDIGARSEA